MKLTFLVLTLLLLAGCQPPCEAELDEWCSAADCGPIDHVLEDAEPTDGECNARPLQVTDCGAYRIVTVIGEQTTERYYDAAGALVAVTQTSEGVYDCEHGLVFGQVPDCVRGVLTPYCAD